MVTYEWDPNKRLENLAKHGVDFHAIESFDWESAVVETDQRKLYGENRYRAIGHINGRLHSVCFAIRHQNCRIISLRKANKRELKKWQEQSN